MYVYGLFWSYETIKTLKEMSSYFHHFLQENRGQLNLLLEYPLEFFHSYTVYTCSGIFISLNLNSYQISDNYFTFSSPTLSSTYSLNHYSINLLVSQVFYSTTRWEFLSCFLLISLKSKSHTPILKLIPQTIGYILM